MEGEEAYAVLRREKRLNTTKGNGFLSPRNSFFLSVRRRCAAEMLIKELRQIAHIGKAADKTDFKDALIRRFHEMTGMFETTLAQILLKRKSKHVLKKVREIRQREMFPLRNLSEQEFTLIVFLDICDDGEQTIRTLTLRQIVFAA